jgi:hypothetical protein
MEVELAGRCGVGALYSFTICEFHHHPLAVCRKGTGICSVNLNPLLFVSHVAFLYPPAVHRADDFGRTHDLKVIRTRKPDSARRL